MFKLFNLRLINPDNELIKKIRQYRYYVIAGIFILFIAVLGMIWKSHNKTLAEKKAEQERKEAEATKYVQVFKVKKVKYVDTIEGLMGSVRGSSLELRSSQEERLLKYNYKPGEYVKKGTVIAELDHTRTQSRFNQEKINYERKQKLFELGGASESEVKGAEESYNLAKKDYDDTFITAPKDGYLGEILLQEGELASRQNPIAYFVSAQDTFFIETSVIEQKVPMIKKGQEAEISIDVFGDAKIKGNLINISPEATTTSRMVPVRISIPKEYKPKLRPGLSASCSITVFDKEVLLIPTDALLKSGNEVYKVDEEKKAHIAKVVLGYQSRDYVEVSNGLEEGDIIVDKPDYSGIKDGGTVRYSMPDEYKIK